MMERKPRKWFFLAWEIPVLVLMGASLRYWNARPKPAATSVGLRLSEPRAGQLRIQWDGAAEPVRKASLGRLEMREGIERQEVALSSEVLSKGSYTYQRANDEVQVRLVVIGPTGERAEEESGFLGQPLTMPSDSGAIDKARENATELEAQARWLRTKNARLSTRIQQLEADLQALETKLQIPGGK